MKILASVHDWLTDYTILHYTVLQERAVTAMESNAMVRDILFCFSSVAVFVSAQIHSVE
jgi:hypothetical protein